MVQIGKHANIQTVTGSWFRKKRRKPNYNHIHWKSICDTLYTTKGISSSYWYKYIGVSVSLTTKSSRAHLDALLLTWETQNISGNPSSYPSLGQNAEPWPKSFLNQKGNPREIVVAEKTSTPIHSIHIWRWAKTVPKTHQITQYGKRVKKLPVKKKQYMKYPTELKKNAIIYPLASAIDLNLSSSLVLPNSKWID